ncbi:hypothetical protein FRC12_006103 [Ceratobasidium sp. 428]|nr:hypothetical protein FRC12_006103 [Ceratobasidium sp. 428]
MRHIIDIPELLELIFADVSVSECAKVLSTSRVVFNAAVARVWNEVPHIRHLLSLIPGLQTLLEGERITPQLPPFSGVGFSRFLIYSPHVKALNISHAGEFVSIVHWNTLLMKAEEVPLLPSLASLHLDNGRRLVIDDEILWIQAFSSTSLRKLTMYSPKTRSMAGDISFIALSVILNHLKKASPSLEQLIVFPDRDSEQSNQSPLAHLLWEGPFYRHLTSLSSLSHLATNTNIFSPDGILALSTLPNLTSLDLASGHYTPHIKTFEGIALPPGSFSALRHIALHFLSLAEIQEIWNMEAIVNKLSSLDIEFSVVPQPDGTYVVRPNFDGFLSGKIPLICARSPCISNLHLGFGERYGEVTVEHCVTPVMVQNLALLLLQRISIHDCLCTALMNNTFSPTHFQVAQWVGMTELRIPFSKFQSLREISYLAALPNLKSLAISLGGLDLSTEDVPTTEQANTRSEVLHTLELNMMDFKMSPSVDTLKDLARYFLDLWPHIWPVRCYEGERRNRPGLLANCRDIPSTRMLRYQTERKSLAARVDELNVYMSELRA